MDLPPREGRNDTFRLTGPPAGGKQEGLPVFSAVGAGRAARRPGRVRPARRTSHTTCASGGPARRGAARQLPTRYALLFILSRYSLRRSNGDFGEAHGRTTMKHGYLIDMDGVLYRGSELIPGADAFIERLRDDRVPFRLLTNNSQRTRRD